MSSGWTCRCTIHNPPGSTSCYVCGSTPGEGSSQTPHSQHVDERTPFLSETAARRQRQAYGGGQARGRRVGGHRDDYGYQAGRGGGGGYNNDGFFHSDVFDEMDKTMLCCAICAVVTLVTIVLLALSLAVVEPTLYGLKQNTWSGTVYIDQPYSNGRYLIGPNMRFIKFPAYDVQLEFSDTGTANAGPISCRTGRDKDDPDSGGQPVKLSVAFTYRLNMTDLGKIYTHFSTDYNARYLQFAQQAVSDITQKYHPAQFWLERSHITQDMKKGVNAVLSSQGFARIINFQILKMEFLDAYEDTIVGIQLAVQMRTTSEYNQQVTKVLKDIDILEAQTQAKIMEVQAQADAIAAVTINQAQAHGFNVTQNVKAEMYPKFAEALGIGSESADLMLKYIRVRNIRQHQNDHLTVGMRSPFRPKPTLAPGSGPTAPPLSSSAPGRLTTAAPAKPHPPNLLHSALGEKLHSALGEKLTNGPRVTQKDDL